jgi:hypothetical protein
MNFSQAGLKLGLTGITVGSTMPVSFFFFFFFFVVLGFELRAYTLSHSTSLFCDRFFFIGPCKLFVRTGFEP